MEAQTQRKTYGLAIEPSEFHPRRDVVQTDLAPAGNLILRVGQEIGEGEGWHQTGHIVLTPDEAREFIAECAVRLEGGEV